LLGEPARVIAVLAASIVIKAQAQQSNVVGLGKFLDATCHPALPAARENGAKDADRRKEMSFHWDFLPCSFS
jgi:hypothetical protein